MHNRMRPHCSTHIGGEHRCLYVMSAVLCYSTAGPVKCAFRMARL